MKLWRTPSFEMSWYIWTAKHYNDTKDLWSCRLNRGERSGGRSTWMSFWPDSVRSFIETPCSRWRTCGKKICWLIINGISMYYSIRYNWLRLSQGVTVSQDFGSFGIKIARFIEASEAEETPPVTIGKWRGTAYNCNPGLTMNKEMKARKAKGLCY